MNSRLADVRATAIALLLAGSAVTPSAAQPPHPNQPVQRATRDLVIEAPNDDWDMRNVYSLVVDARSRIFAWGNDDLKIRIFDSAGRPLRMLGKRGEGPGELSHTGRMAVRSDTVWITESMANRLTSFALNGKGTRTIHVALKSTRASYLQGKLKDGVWMNAYPLEISQTGYTHLFVSANGTLLGTILPFLPSRKRFTYDILQANVRNGPIAARSASLQPFLTGPILEPTFDGARFILAETITSTVGGSESMRLMAIGLNGDTLWNRTTSFTPTRLTDADYQRYVDKLVAPTVMRGIRTVGSRRMITDSLVRPRNFPAFTKLIAGADGSIWLEHGSASSTELFFWRFSSDGVYETCVTVPTGFRFMAATKYQLFGERRDADELITIERYSIKN